MAAKKSQDLCLRLKKGVKMKQRWKVTAKRGSNSLHLLWQCPETLDCFYSRQGDTCMNETTASWSWHTIALHTHTHTLYNAQGQVAIETHSHADAGRGEVTWVLVKLVAGCNEGKKIKFSSVCNNTSTPSLHSAACCCKSLNPESLATNSTKLHTAVLTFNPVLIHKN